MNTTVLASTPSATLSAPSPTAPPPRDQLGDFFRHHGVWAPAVRLFRQLGFGAKAGLISLCFLVPLGLLLAAYISTQQETIRFAEKERGGVALVRAVSPWIIEVQKQRRLVLSGLQPTVDMAAIEAQRSQALKVVASRPAGLDLDKALAPISRQHDAVKALAAGNPPPDMLSGPLQAYVDSLVSMRTSVLDLSMLSLDPEQATYYLMSVSVDQVSAVIEAVSRSRAVAGLLDQSPPASPADLRQLHAIWYQGKERLHGLGDQLARAAEAEPQVSQRLAWDQTLATASRYFDAAEQAWFAGPFSGQVQALGAPGQAAVDALRDFSDKGALLLDELLARRIEAATNARNRVIGGVLLSLLLVAYLFYSFYLVMRGGLGEVARHLQAMTDGDLTTTPRPWGRDEAAALMLSLAEMQASLRAIVGEVRAASDQLVHASSEIASASGDLSQRSEEAAANLEESAAAIEQMASTVQQGASNTGQAAQLSSRNAEVAETSGRDIASVVATMDKVQTSSARIGEIIGVIDGIAFQTNILALNAAVEAARAGEQGRGFAVVAGEVRALAHRSANAAKEIKQLIGASVDHVAAGGQVVSQAGQTIRALVANADRMKALLAEIATGASEQSAGIGQIGQAIQALDRQTQQNAALVEETAAAAEQLQDQAQALVARVARFRMPA